MLNLSAIMLSPITLQAREERRPPVGQPPIADRDIGFATVFLQLENRHPAPQTVMIDRIQIQDTTTGQVYMTTAPQTIHLNPLESSARDFQLTNKTGFADGATIQAIMTLQIAGQPTTLISPAIASDRF